ncbi:unnamed protein product [Sphacelaria rigidula]
MAIAIAVKKQDPSLGVSITSAPHGKLCSLPSANIVPIVFVQKQLLGNCDTIYDQKNIMDLNTIDPDWLSVDGEETAQDVEVSGDEVSADEIGGDEVSADKVSADDLGFTLFCGFIFEKRTRSGVDHLDKYLKEISSWLIESGKLNVDVDPSKAATVDFSDADAARLVDALNTYSPEFPLNFVLSGSSDAGLARRLRLRSPSTYSYTDSSGPLELPSLHGGKVNVEGDLFFDSVVDLLSTDVCRALTTEINVTGSLVGCNSENLKAAVEHLCQGIRENPDDDLFGFSLCGDCEVSLEVDLILVRKWVISFSVIDFHNHRSCLRVSKNF